MDRRVASASSALAILGLALLPGAAAGQQKSASDQLVGTWTLLIDDNVRPDGTESPLFGPNPNGTLTFDDAGHYKLQISRSDSPQPGSSTGTSSASVSHSGTYKADEAAHELTFHDESSSASSPVQKWKFSNLSAEDLKWEAPRTSGEGSELLYWKRAKERGAK